MKSKIANIVLQRANGFCEKCGLRGNDFALHHRKLKSRGGLDSVENLMVVHHSCHNLGSDSIHANPKKAKKMGWMVSSWENPADCPVVMPGGDIVRFDSSGNYERWEINESKS